MGYIEEARARQIFSCVPELKKPLNTLYVGASRKRCHLVDYFVKLGHTLTLLEAFPSNAEFYENDERFVKVVCGDVRNARDHFGTSFDGPMFDAIIWWHGPEHVGKNELDIVIENLESLASIIVLGAPWGYQKQGPVYGNTYERHLAALDEPDLQRLGYRTATIGQKDKRGCNLLAWKISN